jgi:DNA-directed RNA polymerase subunit E"
MEGKVCKSCRIIITHGDKCPLCGGSELTSKWSSYVVVLNAEKSDIAQKLGIKVNSTFALNIKA